MKYPNTKAMTIYKINDKAKEYFDNLPVEKLMTQVEKDALRVNFMDRVFKLLPMTVEKGHLIFDEPEPKKRDYNMSVIEADRAIEAMETFVSYDNKGVAYDDGEYSKAHQAWQQRKDNFVPLFHGEWGTPETEAATKMVIGGDVYDALRLGCRLNPKHSAVPDNWNKVMKI